MKICTALRREYDLSKKVSQNTIVSNIFKICTALRRERDFRLLRLKNSQELFFFAPLGAPSVFFSHPVASPRRSWDPLGGRLGRKSPPRGFRTRKWNLQRSILDHFRIAFSLLRPSSSGLFSSRSGHDFGPFPSRASLAHALLSSTARTHRIP